MSLQKPNWCYEKKKTFFILKFVLILENPAVSCHLISRPLLIPETLLIPISQFLGLDIPAKSKLVLRKEKTLFILNFALIHENFVVPCQLISRPRSFAKPLQGKYNWKSEFSKTTGGHLKKEHILDFWSNIDACKSQSNVCEYAWISNYNKISDIFSILLLFKRKSQRISFNLYWNLLKN